MTAIFIIMFAVPSGQEAAAPANGEPDDVDLPKLICL